jgi:hypothetical protein
MSRGPEACDVVFFLTRADLMAASGPVGDYLDTAGFLAEYPRSRARVLRFNNASTVVTIEDGRLLIAQNDEPPVNLLDVKTFVYFPVSFEPEDVALRPISGQGPDESYSHRQWRVVAAYLESALPGIGRCINPPAQARLAANKLVQIDTARKVGVPIAPTVVTNDADLTNELISTHGLAVRKNLSEGDARARLSSSEGDSDRSQGPPSLIQPFIQTDCELRIYAIGERFVTVKIARRARHEPGDDVRLQTADPADYALSDDYERSYPKLRTYLEVLGLSYAAFDCLPEDGGGVVVLEVNPNGTWQYLPDPIRSSLTAAFHGHVAGASLS